MKKNPLAMLKYRKIDLTAFFSITYDQPQYLLALVRVINFLGSKWKGVFILNGCIY